jgi:hypothetical protein
VNEVKKKVGEGGKRTTRAKMGYLSGYEVPVSQLTKPKGYFAGCSRQPTPGIAIYTIELYS